MQTERAQSYASMLSNEFIKLSCRLDDDSTSEGLLQRRERATASKRMQIQAEILYSAPYRKQSLL